MRMASVSLADSSNSARSEYTQGCRTHFKNICSKFDSVFEARLQGPSNNPAERFLPTDEPGFQLDKGREDLKQLYKLTRGIPESAEPTGRSAKASTTKKTSSRRGPKRRRIGSEQASSAASSEHDASQELRSNSRTEGDVDAEADKFATSVLGHERADGVIVKAKVKILAILISTGIQVDSQPWQNFVHHAMNEDHCESRQLCDTILPFERYAIHKFFGSDKRLNADIFYHQYTMCAPVITERHQTFPEHTVWPFEQVKPMESLSGRKSGTLSKVKVAAGHYHVKTNNGWLFKKDLANNARDAEMARKLSRNTHRHANIVETRATVQLKGITSVFKECGDGTLHNLMSDQDLSGTRFSNGAGFAEKVILIIKYIEVGGALGFFHHGLKDSENNEKLLGIHGDFGPRNIIVVKTGQDFTLKLSDYGLSWLLRPGSSDMSQDLSHTQGEQCECIPPEGLEVIHEDCRPRMSEKYDVFGFACVLCMYLVWLWGGRDAYEDFRKKRTLPKCPFARQPENQRFFQIVGSKEASRNEYTTTIWTEDGDVSATFRLNPAVVLFFETIRDSKKRPLRECRLYWNIFEVLREVALLPNPEQRSSMATVCDRLQQAIKKSKAVQPQP